MVFLFTDAVYGTRRAGAYRIATQLRELDVQVEVIDYLSFWNLENLIRVLDQYQHIDWIGFSTTYSRMGDMYSSTGRDPDWLTDLSYEEDKKLRKYLKDRNIPLVLGGPNADYLKKIVKDFYIIIGYGDDAVKALHQHLTENKPLKHTILNDNKIIYADTDYTNFSIDNINTHFLDSDFVSHNEMIPIEISRGCIFKCAFCYFGHIGKKPGTYIRCKDGIKDDIRRAYEKYGIKKFLFLDDTFNDSIDKMQVIKEVRKELQIPFEFWSYGRLDLLSAHPEMIDLMGEIGWTSVTFGIETLTKKAGSTIGKGANPDRLKETLIKLKTKYPNLHIQANLIIGLPHETKDDIKQTVDWFLETSVVDFLSVRPLVINNPTDVLYSSQISKNPSKYGYTVSDMPGNSNTFYIWKNVNWTQDEAKDFGKEMQHYITQEYKKKAKDMCSFHVLAGTHAKQIAEQYVHKKLEYLEKLHKLINQ